MNRGQPTAVNDGSPPQPRRRIDPLDWARMAGAQELVEQEMRACLRWRRRRNAIAVATTGLAVLLAGWCFQFGPASAPTPATPALPYARRPSKQVMPDGSILEWQGVAGVRMAYTESVRRVWLQQGEAHFDVAKDPGRPFVVVARGIEVRAIGTAFSVALSPSTVEVLVTEGTVAVGPPPDRSSDRSPQGTAVARPPVLVGAGHRVSIDTAKERPVVSTIESVAAGEVAMRLAWRVPWLEMDSTPLAEVIAMVNRHSGRRLIVAEPDLGRLLLSGSLRADNVPVLLQILEMSYGVRAEHDTAGDIVLHRRR